MQDQFSHMGGRHRRSGGENQDALWAEETARFAVIALADGVSSCRRAKCGADIACRTLARLMLSQGSRLLSFPPEDTAGFALSRIRYELQKEGGPAEDYASTAAAVLLDRKSRKLLCFNLGDGLIGGTEAGRCRILAAPSDSSAGCCTTATVGAEQAAAVCTLPVGRLDSVFLCSDGAWEHLTEAGQLTEEAAGLLADRSYGELERRLIAREPQDDFSLIAMELKRGGTRP